MAIITGYEYESVPHRVLLALCIILRRDPRIYLEPFYHKNEDPRESFRKSRKKNC